MVKFEGMNIDDMKSKHDLEDLITVLKILQKTRSKENRAKLKVVLSGLDFGTFMDLVAVINEVGEEAQRR